MGTALQFRPRDKSSRGALRQIRISGRVPGVIYGKGLDSPALISVDAKELHAMLRSHPHAVIEADVPGRGKLPLMLADIQRDKVSREVQHIDFKRINMNEKIKTPVRVEIQGVSPGDKEGGMLQTVLHEVEVECYPKDIPDTVVADVGGLQIGDNLTIADLQFPEGVVPLQDAGMVVVAVLAPQKEAEAEEPAGEPEAAAESKEQEAEEAGASKE